MKRRLRMLVMILSLLLLLSGCAGSPKVNEVLGDGASLVTQTEYGGGVAMLGILPSGDWSVGIAPEGGMAEKRVVTLAVDRPFQEVMAGIAIVAGKAPEGAVRYELLNEDRQVIKGKVEKGVFLVAWPTNRERPAFILRVLDADGNELYRWPPPGSLPAA